MITFFPALIVLAAVFFGVYLIHRKRKSDRIKAHKLRHKEKVKRIVKTKFKNGLKLFVFLELDTHKFKEFKCMALNEKNAKRKYKNFLNSN